MFIRPIIQYVAPSNVMGNTCNFVRLTRTFRASPRSSQHVMTNPRNSHSRSLKCMDKTGRCHVFFLVNGLLVICQDFVQGISSKFLLPCSYTYCWFPFESRSNHIVSQHLCCMIVCSTCSDTCVHYRCFFSAHGYAIVWTFITCYCLIHSFIFVFVCHVLLYFFCLKIAMLRYPKCHPCSCPSRSLDAFSQIERIQMSSVNKKQLASKNGLICSITGFNHHLWVC